MKELPKENSQTKEDDHYEELLLSLPAQFQNEDKLPDQLRLIPFHLFTQQ